MVEDNPVLAPGPGAEGETQPPDPDESGAPEGRLRRWFGPLTPMRIVVLVLAVTFLGGAVGYTVRDIESRAPSAIDVGFLRDMSTHHSQATIIARAAMIGDLPAEVQVYAEEIIVRQQYELGLMQAILFRYGEDTSGDDGQAMGWMGMSVPEQQMPGLASEDEIDTLKTLDGEDAAALFFALMTRHHLGGLHMAQAEADYGKDPYVRGMAQRMADGQRAEVVEYRMARQRLGIGLPDGYPETPDIGFDDPVFEDDGGFPMGLILLGVGVAAVLAAAWTYTRRLPRDTDEELT